MRFDEYWDQYGELHASMCKGDIKTFAKELFEAGQGNGVKPLLDDVRAELEKTLLSEDASSLKQFEKWFAKGHNAGIKKALKIIGYHVI